MKCTIDGYDINYKIVGEGQDTIVILQGWGTKLEVYDSIAKLLSVKYKVVTFDFPGFGGSTEPREVWNVDAYADFFLKLMEELDIKKATLMGHSYGGRVIIKLAARELDSFAIDRIVLVDAAGIVPEKSKKQLRKIRRYKFLKKFLNSKIVYSLFRDMVDAWKDKQGSADYRAASPMMRGCLVAAVNEDLKHLMPHIKQDTLLVWGANDTATPLQDGKTMEQLIPSSGLAVIENAGHYSFLDQPVVFANIMKSYFSLD